MTAMEWIVGRTKYYPRPEGPTRMILISRILIAIWLLAALAEASPGVEASRRSDTPSEQTLRVRFHRGLLRLEASNTPWKQVLTMIQQKSGVRLHTAFSLTGSVSASVPALPVMQALERLFGPEAGFICRYPVGAGDRVAVPREVWILGQVGEGDTISPPHERRGILPALQASASVLPGAATESDAEASVDHETDVIQHLTRMVEDADRPPRVQALSALGRSDKGEAAEIESALDAALDDADPNVRGAALQALVTRGGPKAMERLRQGLQDPDPGVRMLAVGSVASGQVGSTLLEETLSDTDETVRVMARERLKWEPGHTNETRQMQ